MDNRTFTQDGFTVAVQWIIDESPDLSHLGEYGSTWKEWSVDRSTGFVYGDSCDEDGNAQPVAETYANMDRHEFRYWYAPMDLCYSLSEVESGVLTRDDITKYMIQDYERMESYNRSGWCMKGCQVTVTVAGVEVGEASMWGIESDADASYVSEVEGDMVHEAIERAKSSLPEIVSALQRTIDKLSLVTA